LCLVTQVHMHMPLLEAVHYTETDVIFLAEIQRAPCSLSAANTHDIAIVFLWKANAVNALLPVN